MSKKLAAKASLIQMPPMPAEPSASAAERPERSEGEARPKTAPGSMAIFMARNPPSPSGCGAVRW